MDGNPEPAVARGLEGVRVKHRIGVRDLGAGEIPAGQAAIAELPGSLGQPHVLDRFVGSDRGADQPDLDPGPLAGVERTRADGLDTLGKREPLAGMEIRPPADLEIADPVGGLVFDELGGDPRERLRVLEEGDRQLERPQELSLVRAALRRDQGRCHRRGVGWRVAASRSREIEGGPDPDRAVEMEMELGLGHGQQQVELGRIERHSGRMLRCRPANSGPGAIRMPATSS